MKTIISLCIIMFTSLQVLAEQTIIMELYNDKGLMGKQITKVPDDSQFTATTELSWNNRRLTMEEDYQLNDKGFPVEVRIKGISAFGAPVDEHFTVKDGVAKWYSRADEGNRKISQDQFYIPVDGLNNAALVRALLDAPFNQLSLFPNGRAQLNTVSSLDISEGDNKAKVHLYALSGLNLTPQFMWFDDNGHMFSFDGGGFIKGIRAGWSLDTFDKLQRISQQAEKTYYADLSRELTTTLEQPLLIKDANVVDVVNGKLLKQYDVLVEDKRIKMVAENIKQPANAKVIQADGKTLIPGLWDMHGHLS